VVRWEKCWMFLAFVVHREGAGREEVVEYVSWNT
jgi:hypothetical protein